MIRKWVRSRSERIADILGPVNTHFVGCDELLRFRTRRDDRRVL
jgi:hypothetical protein